MTFDEARLMANVIEGPSIAGLYFDPCIPVLVFQPVNHDFQGDYILIIIAQPPGARRR